MAGKKFFCIIAYDIESNKYRAKISNLLEKHGVRINYSVFECMVTAKQLEKIKETANRYIDKYTDTIVYYTLCVDCYTKTVYQPECRQREVKTIKIV